MAVDQNWRWTPPGGTELDLQQLGFNIMSYAGRTVMSGRRSDNMVVPYRHGRLWVPKYYEQRVLTLAMWVVGADPATGAPDPDPQSKMWQNVEMLSRAFVTDRGLGLLKKLHPTQGKDVVAEAEVADQIDFRTNPGAQRAVFIVDLTLPNVWFEDVNFVGESAYVSRNDQDTWTVTVDSDVPIYDPVIQLRAPATGTPSNIVLTNQTLGADFWMKYSDVMQSNEEVVIDAGKWTAVLDGATNVVNNVRSSGQPQFFQLVPGANVIKIDVTGGPVDVMIKAKGKYW